jgi:peptidylprolyl isomerase
MKWLMLIVVACAALVVAGCGDDDSSSDSTGSTESTAAESPAVESSGDAADRSKPKVTVPSGAPPKQLEETELIEGTGAEAKSGDKVTVQYVGVNFENGQEFDSSWSRSEPFSFTLGASEVIPGWDQGVEGMKVGGQRQLVIPPELAYGEAGAPPAIGPNETLVFVIDLLEVG